MAKDALPAQGKHYLRIRYLARFSVECAQGLAQNLLYVACAYTCLNLSRSRDYGTHGAG